ncbi:unnamed protein product [Urochloa decumbens]|uniref:Uncharacterized protein n=1 Tax=Urochloa decumbens TaxID=240449 RepID=A0ABC9BR92_9POAL
MEEVGTIPGDNQAMYDKICRSVVRLVCYEPARPDKPKFTIPGVIAMSGSDYCYIIALRDAHVWSSIGPFEVILPDGAKMKLQKKEVETRLNLMAFYFYVSTSAFIKSVEFSMDAISLNEEVFTFGFGAPMLSCEISPGRVTHERQFSFSHDSPPSIHTSSGDLVFNKQAEFVGISYKDHGVTIALSVESITKLLSLFHKNMEGKSLSEILQHIDVQAKSHKKRKKDGLAKSHTKRKKKSH